MNIPKKLHYVWVGGNEIPTKVKLMMKNNKKVLGSNWKIKIWTEKDFDINSNPFTKYWYEKKNWAFVSDYIRAYAVHKEGGFYIDTDVLLNKSLDSLVNNDYVASRTYITENTMSIFGAKKGSKILKTYMAVMEHQKMINKPPRIMSTDIHTYALSKSLNIPALDSNYTENGISIYKESILQIDLKNGENISVHEHHDNWTGNNKEGKISKYYRKKIDFYNNLTNKDIQKQIKFTNKMNNRIERLFNK